MSNGLRIDSNLFVRLALTSKPLPVEDSPELPEVTEEIEYVHGYGFLVPGLDIALRGLAVGDEFTLTLDAEQAHGPYDDDLVFDVDRSEFPNADRLEAGDEVLADGLEAEPISLRVLEVRPDSFLVDANHPWAGRSVCYTARVLALRDATDAELSAAAEHFDSAFTDEDDEVPMDGPLVRLRRKDDPL